MMEIIDLNRYGIFNWLTDSVWGNLTKGGFFFLNKDKKGYLSSMEDAVRWDSIGFSLYVVVILECYRTVKWKLANHTLLISFFHRSD